MKAWRLLFAALGLLIVQGAAAENCIDFADDDAAMAACWARNSGGGGAVRSPTRSSAATSSKPNAAAAPRCPLHRNASSVASQDWDAVNARKLQALEEGLRDLQALKVAIAGDQTSTQVAGDAGVGVLATKTSADVIEALAGFLPAEGAATGGWRTAAVVAKTAKAAATAAKKGAEQAYVEAISDKVGEEVRALHPAVAALKLADTIKGANEEFSEQAETNRKTKAALADAAANIDAQIRQLKGKIETTAAAVRAKTVQNIAQWAKAEKLVCN